MTTDGNTRFPPPGELHEDRNGNGRDSIVVALTCGGVVAQAQTRRIANQGDRLSMDPLAQRDSAAERDGQRLRTPAGAASQTRVSRPWLPFTSGSRHRRHVVGVAFELRMACNRPRRHPSTADDVDIGLARTRGQRLTRTSYTTAWQDRQHMASRFSNAWTMLFPIPPRRALARAAIASAKWCETNQATRARGLPQGAEIDGDRLRLPRHRALPREASASPTRAPVSSRSNGTFTGARFAGNVTEVVVVHPHRQRCYTAAWRPCSRKVDGR